MLKAVGKYIDTLPIGQLISQEEMGADTVLIEVDRFYNGRDLKDLTFLMRGVTTSGGETETLLEKEVQESVIRLRWTVGGDFTKEKGELQLDLVACSYAEGSDPETDAPDCILRYQLPPVQVRGLPDNEEILDTKSYTIFLLQVRETAEQTITQIEQLIQNFKTEILPAQEERIAALEKALQELQIEQTTLRHTVEELSTSVERLKAATRVIAVTRTAYEALDPPDADTVYVIKDE